MFQPRYFRPLLCAAMMTALTFFSNLAAAAQDQRVAPETSVAGVKLGHRASGREFLLQYLPTTGEDGRPTYFFYNKYATQIMKLTAASFDDPYFITEIEVYAVGKSYTTPHFVAEKIGHFMTEDRIFIGFEQSVKSMLIGIPGVSRGDMIGPKDIAKKKGEPDERLPLEADREAFVYKFPNLSLTDEKGAAQNFDYTARYEFRKSKVKRIKLSIAPTKSN